MVKLSQGLRQAVRAGDFMHSTVCSLLSKEVKIIQTVCCNKVLYFINCSHEPLILLQLVLPSHTKTQEIVPHIKKLLPY